MSSCIYNRDILTPPPSSAMASIVTSIAQFIFIMFFRGEVVMIVRAEFFRQLAESAGAPRSFAAILIQFSLSRTREYDADEDGAYLTEDPLALASALALESGNTQYPLQATPQTQNKCLSNDDCKSLQGQGLRNLFSTHPPMDQRIARLEHIAGY